MARTTRSTSIVNVLPLLCCYLASVALAQDDNSFDDLSSFTDDIYGFYNDILIVPCMPKYSGSQVRISSFRGINTTNHFEIRSTQLSNVKKNYEFDFDKVTYHPETGFIFAKVRNMPLTMLCYNNIYAATPIRFQITLIERYQLNQPIIRSKNHGNVVEGEPFQLVCEVRTKLNDFKYSLSWNTTEENRKPKYSLETVYEDNENSEIGVERLTLYIERADKNDTGIYTCIHNLPDSRTQLKVATYQMRVLAPYEHYLELDNPTVSKERGIHFEIGYRGFPPPTLQWTNKSGRNVRQTRKRLFQYRLNKAILRLLPREGSYSNDMILTVSNGFAKKKVYLKQSTYQITESHIMVV